MRNPWLFALFALLTFQRVLYGEELKALFRFPLGGLLAAPPLAAGGMVYLLSENRTFYGMEGEGTLKLTAKTEQSTGRLSKGAFGQVFLIYEDRRIHALNGLGAEAFSFSSGSEPIGSPLQVCEGRIFLASRESLDCFSVIGLKKWSIPLDSPPILGPVLCGDSGIADCLEDGTVILVSPFGEILFKTIGPSSSRAIAFSQDRIAALFEDGALIIFDLSGLELARLYLPRGLSALKPLPEGGFACLAGEGSLFALDLSGGIVWEKDFSREKPEGIETGERRIFLFAKSFVRSLDLEGNALRRISLEHAYSLPTISPEGILYSGGEDWILYAYRFDEPRPEGQNLVDYGLSELRYPWKDMDLRFPDEGYRGILLDGFEKSLKSNSIGIGEKAAFEICASIALEEIEKARVRTNKPENKTILARSRACSVLGSLGSLEARPILERVLLEDPDTAVRAQAARALGALGADPEGKAVSLFHRLFEARVREEQLAQAVVEAIEAMARFQGAFPDEEALLVLVSVAEGPYSSPLRNRAFAAMKSMGAVRRQ